MVDNLQPTARVTSKDEWEAAFTLQVAKKIQLLRRRRNLSAADLAAACSRVAGEEVKESAVQALFAGRRKSIAVTEVLVYAAALKCAPVELLVPVGLTEVFEILPNVVVTPRGAAVAVSGGFDAWAMKPDRDAMQAAFGSSDPQSAVELFQSHQVTLVSVLLSNGRVVAGRGPRREIDTLREHINNLRRIRAEMTRSNYRLPRLPRGLEIIDEVDVRLALPLLDVEDVDLAERHLLGYQSTGA